MNTEVAAIPSKPKAWVGWLFAGIWLVYLVDPLKALFAGRHGVAEVASVLAAVALFSVLYIWLAQLSDWGPWADPARRVNPLRMSLLAGMAAIALILPAVVDPSWVVLWIYVSTSCGYSLPRGHKPRPELGLICGLSVAGVMGVEAMLLGVSAGDWIEIFVPTLISCLATAGVRRMQQLISALHEARAEVARLAASEERLRMARDLHDLAGHSLATITLKAELARKLMTVDQSRAEQQILDLEHVSRQALADIREAVSGYRRATLAVEMASARTALAAADIALDADPSVALRSGELDAQVEEALAWCLREAVTNVVRHSRARVCRIRLIEATVDGASTITLEVLDDGVGVDGRAGVGGGGGGGGGGVGGAGGGAGAAVHEAATGDPVAFVPAPAPAADTAAPSAPLVSIAASLAPAATTPAASMRPAPSPGNGLSGLRERLAVVSAESRLTAAPVPCGFRLTATVPHRPSTKTGTPQ
jgi:two-component system sensor histidine kinase DesK